MGERIAATTRDPKCTSSTELTSLLFTYPTQLLVLKLDVTKPEDVTNAFAKAKEVFGRIDVVLNNAGYGILAEFEGTPEDVAACVSYSASKDAGLVTGA